MQPLIVGLRPGTRYRFRFVRGDVASRVGTFETAPRRTANASVRFAISGDADATPAANGKPAYSFRVYARMAAERNDFNINLGDTIYSDSASGARRSLAPSRRSGASTSSCSRSPSSAGFAQRPASTATGTTTSSSTTSRAPSTASELYRAGVTAFRHYSPVRFGANGLYRSVRWGRNLELFFLDERSFRSAKVASACHADLAPTAPQAVRDAFANLAPALRNPVPPGCLAAINDPSRTILGARQYAAFTRAIAASTATWKVVLNEVPMQQYYVLPYDRWEGYAAERERLLRASARWRTSSS